MENFIYSSGDSKMIDFQDLDHIDGLSISTISANLYNKSRDDLVMFYFRDGANHASVYTQSKIVSENIKWNLNLKSKKIKILLVNTRNANAFTGAKGFQSLKEIADELSSGLTKKQIEDEDKPEKVSSGEIMFGCTGTIGEEFPKEKIKRCLPQLINKIRYTQNKLIWMKAALSMMTTDTQPKMAMEICSIGNSEIKIFGVAKGSGMIQPNMATMLVYIFIECEVSKQLMLRLLKNNLDNTFNSITVDSDTSTSDTLMMFSVSNKKINLNKKNFKIINNKIYELMHDLSLQVIKDGEGVSKLIRVNVLNARSKNQAKKIAFSIANSPLVKTAVAGEDANWGRVIMAIGKTEENINQNKIKVLFGNNVVCENGSISKKINIRKLNNYIKNKTIEINVKLNLGKYFFTVHGNDLTFEYLKINADYRS